MRQIATGPDGTGYIISYERKGPPADLVELQGKILATPNDKRNEGECAEWVKEFNEGMAKWQAEGGKTVAHLIADGVFVGEFETGWEARAYTHDEEEGILTWRTE